MMSSDDGASTRLWSIDQIAEYYAQYASDYDKDIVADAKNYPGPFIVGSWLVEHLLQNVKPTDPVAFKVLDLGCGTGQSSTMFFSHSQPSRFKVTGVDATPQMLERARRFPFTSLLCQDIETFPLPGGPYDAVVCVGVMDFIKSPDLLFAEIHRLLEDSPKGYFGVTLPDSGDLNNFSPAQVEELATKAGFKVLKQDRFLGYTDSSTGEVVHYLGFLLKA